jgi:hypothetical protein
MYRMLPVHSLAAPRFQTVQGYAYPPFIATNVHPSVGEQR